MNFQCRRRRPPRAFFGQEQNGSRGGPEKTRLCLLHSQSIRGSGQGEWNQALVFLLHERGIEVLSVFMLVTTHIVYSS